MGWGDCGTDVNGRGIGYMHSAVCDHNGCENEIDRGLSYACGGMHGETEYGCDKYFCEEHRNNIVDDVLHGSIVRVCDSCAQSLIDGGEMVFDDGAIVRKL